MRDQRKEKLIEQYEEAALGLLMEEYAEAEGARLLQAQQSDDTVIPEELDAKCLALIDRAHGKFRRRQLVSNVCKAAGKAAAIALVFLGLASATVLSVDAFRTPVLNFLLEHTEKYTAIHFGDSQKSASASFENISDLVFGLVPEGYQLFNEPDVNDYALDMRFRNDAGNFIYVAVFDAASSNLSVDTEDASYAEMEIAGHQALFIQKNGYHIVWFDENTQLLFDIAANGLSEKEFWMFVHPLASIS